MLFGHLTGSICIYMYMLFQECADDVAIPHEPEVRVGVPFSACRFGHGSIAQAAARS